MFCILSQLLLRSEHLVGAPKLGIEVYIDFILIKHRIIGITAGQRSFDIRHFS